MIKIEVLVKGGKEKEVAHQIQCGIYKAVSEAEYINVSVKSDELMDEGRLTVIGMEPEGKEYTASRMVSGLWNPDRIQSFGR